MSAPSPYRTVIEAMFQIVDRSGAKCDFTLNSQQCELDAEWSRRNLITKIRQHAGISTYVIGRYVAKCLGQENRRCVIVSAEADATARLLARARFILNNLKGDLKPQLGTDNQRAITFPKNGSSFWIGTAGSRVFGRGDTITDLHLSEAAFYDNPSALADGLFPAAELGEITIESTGNGSGNWFHRQAVRAREGLGFKLFFFSWRGVETCAIPFRDEEERARFGATLREEFEEPTLWEAGITLEQLAWRRERIVEYEGDLQRFKANYPLDFDECFQSSGYGFFRRVRYVPTTLWVRVDANTYALSEHPKPGLSYVLGADPSGGVGRDNSVAEVFCLETQEQVAEFASPWSEPPQFADEIARLAHVFNHAYVNVERNNHGGTTLARLLDIYPVELLHRGSRGEASTQEVLSHLSRFGTLVTPASRGIILGTARQLLAEQFTVHSPSLAAELTTFKQQVDGKIEANEGCFDDRVMAACHALIVCEQGGVAASDRRFSPPLEGELDPFAFETLFGRQTLDARRVERFGTPERFH